MVAAVYSWSLTASLVFCVRVASKAQHYDKCYKVTLKNVLGTPACHSTWCKCQQGDCKALLSALRELVTFMRYVLVLTSGCDTEPYMRLFFSSVRAITEALFQNISISVQPLHLPAGDTFMWQVIPQLGASVCQIWTFALCMDDPAWVTDSHSKSPWSNVQRTSHLNKQCSILIGFKVVSMPWARMSDFLARGGLRGSGTNLWFTKPSMKFLDFLLASDVGVRNSASGTQHTSLC